LAGALTVPHAVVALVLIVAGAAKLRSPAAAAHAVGAPPPAIRAYGLAEVALGAWALLAAGPVASGLMAAAYAGFAALTVMLARQGAACGCFGSERAPASPIQSLLSGVLALVAAAGAIAGVHGAAWILQQPAATAAVLVVGTVGAVYGVVLAYSELPLVWQAWSPAA
jgi:hypothetical protein